MSEGHFLRIEREGPGRSRHYVVHTVDPRFSLELTPDTTATDRMGSGVIRRLCVPNSWAGDYGKYSKLIGAAQEFFRKTLAAAAEGPEPRPRKFNR